MSSTWNNRKILKPVRQQTIKRSRSGPLGQVLLPFSASLALWYVLEFTFCPKNNKTTQGWLEAKKEQGRK